MSCTVQNTETDGYNYGLLYNLDICIQHIIRMFTQLYILYTIQLDFGNLHEISST